MALIAGAPASAATKTVTMGAPASAAKQLQPLFADANDFFPRTSTIRVGDRVRFVPMGFHNVDLPPAGGRLQPLFLPTGDKAQGEQATDAAGAPFWFTGQDVLGFNPALLPSSFGRTRTFDGSARVQSGLPLGANLKPFVVRFTKRGTYRYFCDVHQGMKGVVRVKGRRSAVPTARQDRRRTARQAARAVTIAKGLARTTAPANTIRAGVAGPAGVEILAFSPARTTVPVGTTLRFLMGELTYEVHTATTGPARLDDRGDATTYLNALSRSFEAPKTDPRATYPSEPPGGAVADLTPSLHGNGFWNSGVLDGSPSPLPAEGSVRMAQAGTYDFYCLIHPFMKTTVTVQ